MIIRSAVAKIDRAAVTTRGLISPARWPSRPPPSFNINAGVRVLAPSRIEGRDGFLVLQVRDDGRGITPQEISATKSLGLFGMRERVLLLAGDLNIRGALGEGTMVLVKVPLALRKADV